MSKREPEKIIPKEQNVLMLPEPKGLDNDWSNRHREREEEREEIRQRVRQATSQNEYFRPAKPIPTLQDETDKVVAVYARVSTLSTDQTSSIENQTQYYKKKVAENPHWSLYKIYSDEGKSGTSLRKRDAFNEMMEDARAKKINLILCASVSRFARNVADCMEMVHDLASQNPSDPVAVYFETENLYTLDPNCEQALGMHAILADWESSNKSRRMILSYDQRILTGQYPVSDLLGYRHTKDGRLIIQPEEAKTVRFMFLARLAGYSFSEIADVLTEKERPTLKGRVEWNGNMVRSVMSNERTWGDLEARKTIVLDYRKGVIIKNKGQRDSAYVPGHHKGIVSPEIARAARLLSASRTIDGGVPDLNVITYGALKGFISVHPGWLGIDADTLELLCLSAYRDDEKEELSKRVALIEGESHSQVMSMQLSGYQVPPGAFFISKSTASITFTPSSIHFNRASHTKMGNSEYVELLYHPLFQTIILRESDEETGNSFRWMNGKGQLVTQISARALSEAIYQQYGWDHQYRFRFRGIPREREGVHYEVFFLDEPLILQHRKKCSDEMEEAGLIQYVPYQIKQRREEAINSITKADLENPGTAAINPLIGEMPTHEEILEELDQLLMSM